MTSVSSPQCSPIIRVCRKRSADPQSALVLSLKRHKADPLIFSLFKTSIEPEVRQDSSDSPIIDFRPKIAVAVQNETDNANPLAFANDSVNEVGGPEPVARTDSEILTLNGRPLVGIAPEKVHDEELVFDFYKISHGVILHDMANPEEFDMRFATKEEVLLYGNEDSSGDEGADDDDDSNDEDNWRNDYPDEDDGESGSDESERESLDGYVHRDDSDDDGLRLRMQRFGIGEEEYGSEDDEDV